MVVFSDEDPLILAKSPFLPDNTLVQYKRVSGDKTSDTLTGAIIGGIIGNNVTRDLPDGGTAGAILGGILGHMNSDARSEIKKVCNIETRYEEVQKEVYSHSTITFWSGGKQYTLRFKK